MKKDLYFVEVGVLLPPNHDDYESYQIRHFHNEFGFYDENKLTFLTQEKATEYAEYYVKNGANNTYAILYNFNCDITEQELDDIKNCLYCECSLEMPIDTITRFFYKQNNDIINFDYSIKGQLSYHSNELGNVVIKVEEE